MLIADEKPDLILLTEVIPKAQVNPIPPAVMVIPEFNMYLNFDPSKSNLGGAGMRGICIFVSSSLQATEVFFPHSPFKEHLWLRIPLQSPDQLLIGCIYRSPSANGNTSSRNLVELLKDCGERYSHTVIAGDVNMPQIEWATNYSPAPDGHYTHLFIEGIQDCGLVQHVTKATRYREGERPNTLDVILSNEEGLVQNLAYLPPIGSSDHIVLQFEIACYAKIEERDKMRFNLNKGNYQLLNELIRETDWDGAAHLPLQQRYETFKETLTCLVERCVPKACPRGKRQNIYITREAIRLKKKKKKLWAAYIRHQDDINHAQYVRSKNDLRRLTRNLRKSFEQRLVEGIKENPKGFWRYASSRMKTRPGVENLRTENGELTTNDDEKAAVLNRFFSSVCTHEELHNIPTPEITYDGPILEEVDISVEVVKKKLSALRPNAAAGPDDIHPRILRETAATLSQRRSATLSPLLADLFRSSLDSGVLPDDWKLADVVPIYKKGGKDEAQNYRPVSLTSVSCKILESILRDILMAHLQTENLLTDAQHGFRPGRSCASQLLLAMEEWTRMLENGEPVDVLYLDLAKAFNTVPPRRLLRKVEAHGIGGKILQWIGAFLLDRHQRVIVGRSRSGWTPVPSGVPQGSVLAPLLFILYVNDLPSALNCGIKIFADDSKLYKSVILPADPIALQKDLDAAARWAEEWQLTFNAAKCKVLHIGHRNRHHVYTLSETALEETAAERDLGVFIDADLKFRRQAAAAVSKASQVMAVIRRSFQLLDKSTLPMLFKTLVRPHLEYGNIVWGPFNRADQQLVERVQRRATKIVPELRHLSYPQRLRALKLPSLYYRRRRGDMIAVFQLLHGGLDLDPDVFFNTAVARDTRGHPWRLVKPRAVSRIRCNAFSVRVVNDWNSLPSTVVTSATLNQFKNRLDAHWIQIAHATPHTDG